MFMIKIDFHNKRLTKLNQDQDGHMKESVLIVVILKAAVIKVKWYIRYKTIKPPCPLMRPT